MSKCQYIRKWNLFFAALIYIRNMFFLKPPVKISIAIFKRDRFSTPGAGDKMSERHQQPISLDPFGGTDLIPAECQTAFALPKKDLNRPATVPDICSGFHPCPGKHPC